MFSDSLINTYTINNFSDLSFYITKDDNTSYNDVNVKENFIFDQ